MSTKDRQTQHSPSLTESDAVAKRGHSQTQGSQTTYPEPSSPMHLRMLPLWADDHGQN